MKAIVIISGGLDSSLAIKAIQKQKIEVIAVHILIPFVKYDTLSIETSPAAKIAQQLGCQFRIITLGNEYLEMLQKPKAGYGKNLNPCIDCKILMLNEAKKIMQEQGASFVATGEVLGQRPMSQYKQALLNIAKRSGLEGLLVRPLSAKLLPLTTPQIKGWLKDEFLFDFFGRSRKSQIALAKEWGIKDYSWPAGGCLLTDPNFSRRLKDLIEHKECTLGNIELLKVGRHFRVNSDFKLIVGRNQEENKKMVDLAGDNDLVLEPEELPGPTGVGRGLIDQPTKELAGKIIAHYTSQGRQVKINMRYLSKNNQETFLARDIDEVKLQNLRV